MLRVVLINIFLFLLPLLLYGLYVWLVKRKTTAGEILDDAPIVWLLVIGCLSVIGVVVYLISFETGKPGQTYYPARIEDGKIKPGRVE